MLIVVLVVTVLFVLFLRTNPTGREFFDRARNLIAVNLLTITGICGLTGLIFLHHSQLKLVHPKRVQSVKLGR